MSANTSGNERKELYFFAGKILSEFKSQKILDIACGNGAGACLIASMIPSAEIFGIDLNAALVQKAENQFKIPNIHFSLGDARALNFPQNHFDSIVSFHTIEHFDKKDQQKFLGELFRILEPKGKLIIATPDRDVWDLQGIAGVQEDHICELNQKEFLLILKNFGFKWRDVYGQGILKEDSGFLLRKFLNLLKKFDILKLRKKFFQSYIRAIDSKTQPIVVDYEVKKLEPGQKASITVLICKKEL